jgi:hypothetical protein
VKVLAAGLGTKGWGWQSWGVGNSVEKRKFSGGKTGLRGWLMGVGHFCLVFRNEHTVRRAIDIPKICKLNLNQFHYRPE